VEKGYRHSTATSIYGGTSEVLRSMVAERASGCRAAGPEPLDGGRYTSPPSTPMTCRVR